MKICKRGLYAQIIDGEGTVRTCSWAGYYTLGKLTENTMEELFTCEKAKEFQRSLIEGTYDYCSEENCPYMANGTLDTFMVDVDEIPKTPQILSLAYDNHCNYKCTCCISKCNTPTDIEKQKKVEREIEKCLPNVKELSANGLGELFVSESMLNVISKWKVSDSSEQTFEIETNGSLFNEKNWNKINNIGKANLRVAITVMSFDEKAYQFLSGTKLEVNQIIENLRFVKRLREEKIINFLEIATVVQERNFRTLPEFVDRCLNEFGADSVRLRRFLPEKAMDENIEWFFDVRNPLHPYHKEFLEVMKHPIFANPRVFKWTGDNLSNRGDIPARAGLRVMNKLFLTENAGEKLAEVLKGKGYDHIVLYAIGNLCKAVIKTIENQGVTIDYIVDAHTQLKNFEGFDVKTTTNEVLSEVKVPILVTLAARHNEMEEYIRHRGFKGTILSLEELLGEIE